MSTPVDVLAMMDTVIGIDGKWELSEARAGGAP